MKNLFYLNSIDISLSSSYFKKEHYRLCLPTFISVEPRNDSHVSCRPMAAALRLSAITRALTIPANRATLDLCMCIWRWRSLASLLSFADFFGKKVSNNTIAVRTWRISNHRSESVVRGVRHVREIAAISHRLLGRACIAQARPRWPAVVAFVVVVMEACSVPIDTPAAEYRPWRLPLSRVTHPEINAPTRVPRSLTLDRSGDGKRERGREYGAWCESVAEAAASPRTRRALSPL